MTKTVRRLLENRSGPLWTITPNQPARDAVTLMSAKGIGALLVTEGEQLVGIVTERDIVRKFSILTTDTTSVRDLMTERVLYVDPDQTVDDCMALMTERHVRHLPVLDGGRLVGIVSIRDVVADVIVEQSFMIEQLEHYITGGRPR